MQLYNKQYKNYFLARLLLQVKAKLFNSGGLYDSDY